MKQMQWMEWRLWLAIGTSSLFMASMIGCLGVGETTTGSAISASQLGSKAVVSECGSSTPERKNLNHEIDNEDESDSDSGSVNVDKDDGDHEDDVTVTGCDDTESTKVGHDADDDDGDGTKVGHDTDDDDGDSTKVGDDNEVAKAP
jgi:hypothetical protein